jgi:hypothetical protein
MEQYIAHKIKWPIQDSLKMGCLMEKAGYLIQMEQEIIYNLMKVLAVLLFQKRSPKQMIT